MTHEAKHIVLTACLLILSANFVFSSSYPKDVTSALNKASSNRSELIKVLDHYADDSLKYRAACFLIANMSVHESRSFYWADSLNNKVAFNELSFTDFGTAVSNFNKIALRLRAHPVTIIENDLDKMSAAYLIDNINKAFELKNRPWARYLTFEQFCEYLLPYRFMNESYSEWRGSFQKEYVKYMSSLEGKHVRQACVTLCDSLKKGFYNTYVTNPEKVEPALLSPAQLLFRKQGACEDIANWGGYIFRSFGIATTIDYTPAWATSTGSHYWNVSFGEHGESIPYVMCSSDSPNKYYLHREPSKVLRVTYSSQKETLAQRIPANEIPDGHLRCSNYLDVTRDYWKVADLTVKLDSINTKTKIAFVAVLNGLTWRPVWWGAIEKTQATFADLSCGVVYLPMLYKNGRLSPAATPQLLRRDATVQVLKPDTSTMRSISLAQQEGYLIFQPGKRYALFYWQGSWQQLGVKIAKDASPLTFERVPSNALLLLIPEYSQNKERPFTINTDGVQEWW